MIAGLTVGLVLVPQAMAYAKVATLPPEYGLYSSCVGAFVYSVFSTSKDVSIGPVVSASLEIATIIKIVQSGPLGNTYEGHVIASAVGFLVGIVIFGIGLLRLGWIVEFISAPAVAGFSTGAALNICITQMPSLMGISKYIDTSQADYIILLQTMKYALRPSIDAAFGLSGLNALYAIRYTLEKLSKRYPQYQRPIFFAQSLRSAVVLSLLTLGSYFYCHGKAVAPISILKDVPRGFRRIGPPVLDRPLLEAVIPHVPVCAIIIFLEQVTVAKIFGKINHYEINPSQELVGNGVQNIVSTFFSGYPSTGAFSRTALNSKSGVHTPLGSWVAASIVIMALYTLSGLAYYIPNAGLAAIIIHAIADIIASPSVTYRFWRLSPFECFIFLGAVFATIFSSIETGIYFSITASLALMLVRIARPRSHWVGIATVQVSPTHGNHTGPSTRRTVFVPFTGDHSIDNNPYVKVRHVAPGVFIYRPDESITYPNSYRLVTEIYNHIKVCTRRGGPPHTSINPGERPWNDPGPAWWNRKKARDLTDHEESINERKPLAHAIIFDLGVSSHIDVTGLQALLDVKAKVEYWKQGPVELHFANIQTPWVRRVLVAGGLGRGQPYHPVVKEFAPLSGLRDDADALIEYGVIPRTPDSGSAEKKHVKDEEAYIREVEVGEAGTVSLTPSRGEDELGTLVSVETPFIHFDLTAAVRAATGKIDF
jgi:sodium-independent sulfate anion transporter 11